MCYYLGETPLSNVTDITLYHANNKNHVDPTIYQSEMLIILLLILRTMFMVLSIINVTARVLSARHSSLKMCYVYLRILAGVNNVSLSVHDAIHRDSGKTVWVDEVQRGGE